MARAGLSSERVAAAGAELADEIGFEAVTPAALARRLGVRTASLYSHVRSSADLKTRITVVALNELADQVAETIAGCTRAGALSGMAGVYRDYARRHPGRFAATLGVNGDDPAVLLAGRRHARLMAAVLRGYHLQAPAVPHAIRFVGAAVRGFASLELGGGFDHSDPPAADSWPHAVAALDVVLTNWPALPDPPPHTTKEN